jgi:hypothetical protein
MKELGLTLADTTPNSPPDEDDTDKEEVDEPLADARA